MKVDQKALSAATAAIRDVWLRTVREGLGVERMGAAEERRRVAGLERRLLDVYTLAATMHLADVLGIGEEWRRVVGAAPSE